MAEELPSVSGEKCHLCKPQGTKAGSHGVPTDVTLQYTKMSIDTVPIPLIAFVVIGYSLPLLRAHFRL